jgi:hypothetical protein
MSRNFLISLSFLCLLAICAMITNCGSSSKSGGGNGGGPYDVVGDWQLTLSGSSTTGYGVINTTGLALFFDNLGETLELPTITGASSFSGTATIYEPGGASSTATVQGNVNSATSISGTLSGNGSGSFTAASYSAVTSVTALSGAMTGESWSGALLELTLSPSGSNASMSFTGSNGISCDVSGTFTQEGGNVATLNVFDVSMTFSGTGCPTLTTTAITGLGLESSSDYLNFNSGSPGTYLYADMLDPAGPFILEIYVPVGAAAASRHISSPERRGSPWAGKF